VPQRRFEAADSVLLRMARHFSGNAWLRQLRVLLPAAGRDYDAAEAVLDSLEDSGVPDDGLPIRDYRCGLALVRGHLSEFRRQCGFYAPVVRAFWELRYTGDTARVGRMVDSVADRSRDSLAPEDGSYALLATTLAELGRAREARQCLALWQQLRGADEDEGLRRDAGRVAGSIALAEGKLDSAVTAFLAWNTTGDPYVFNLGLPEAANAHDLAGRSDSAIALYERALATPSILGFNVERSWYPHALRRLGELHESLGHREQAIVYYSQFIELWKNADPELEPRVQDARETLARLVGEPQP
nr:hypothetical protein [Gemmatimonadales bacterium]